MFHQNLTCSPHTTTQCSPHFLFMNKPAAQPSLIKGNGGKTATALNPTTVLQPRPGMPIVPSNAWDSCSPCWGLNSWMGNSCSGRYYSCPTTKKQRTVLEQSPQTSILSFTKGLFQGLASR